MIRMESHGDSDCDGDDEREPSLILCTSDCECELHERWKKLEEQNVEYSFSLELSIDKSPKKVHNIGLCMPSLEEGTD